MNRAQRTFCHVTNGAIAGAVLFLIVPFPDADPHHTDVQLVSHR